MRYVWKVALASLAALTLASCSNDDQGGGGGKASQDQAADANRYPQTYENSNPVSRAQEHGQDLPLRAVPNSGKAVDGQVGDERVRNAETTQIAQGGAVTTKLDVNHASLEELARVPGIGYNTAKAIVNNRPYKDRADLLRRVPELSRQQLSAFDRYIGFGPAGIKGNQ